MTKFNIELEWEAFASAIANRHLKPSQYTASVIKHLIAILYAVNSHPVYYSLSYPTLLEGSPARALTHNTLMQDIKEIMTNVNTIRNRTASDNIIHQLKFDYFHAEHDKYQEVTPSALITKYDHTLLPSKKFNQARVFPATSQFWKGCIAVATV